MSRGCPRETSLPGETTTQWGRGSGPIHSFYASANGFPSVSPSLSGIVLLHGPLAQLVAHLHDAQGVTGSSPVRPTRKPQARSSSGLGCVAPEGQFRATVATTVATGSEEVAMARQNMNGEGSIYRRRSDGMWIGAVTVGYDDKGRMSRQTVSARTKKSVIERKRKLQQQLDEGLPPPDDLITVKTLFDRWFNDVMRHRIAGSALDNYRTIANLHIIPVLGRRRVNKVTVRDVDSLLSVSYTHLTLPTNREV